MAAKTAAERAFGVDAGMTPVSARVGGYAAPNGASDRNASGASGRRPCSAEGCRVAAPYLRGEYDEAFLDWIFWWYLATVELTNRLIASRNPA